MYGSVLSRRGHRDRCIESAYLAEDEGLLISV